LVTLNQSKMETQLSMFGEGSGVSDTQDFYLLTINPSWEVSKYVSGLKKSHQAFLGAGFGLASKPHITVAGFPLYAGQLGLFSRRLEAICRKWNEIKIDVNGFRTFDNSSTICLNVLPNDSLYALYLNIAHFMRNELRAEASHWPRSYTPHITVVRNLDRLDESVYQQLWTAYEEKDYTGDFIADKLVLLKYKANGVGTDLCREFKLGGEAYN